jgi:hypothetical protein
MTSSSDSGNAAFYKPIHDLLEERAKSVRPLQRVELSRKELLATIRTRQSCPEGEPEISFEEMEPNLSHGFILGDCRVGYNPFTEQIVFEGIPTVDNLERMAELTNDLTMTRLRAQFDGLDGFAFQRAVAEILRNLPWVKRVEIKRLTGDGGIDFDAIYFFEGVGDLVVCGQVKRSAAPVGPEEVRAFIGSLVIRSPRPNLGVFVAIRGFSTGVEAAVRAASQRAGVKIQTYTLDDLLLWMKGNGIGVNKRTLEVEAIDSTFWKEVIDGGS